MKHSKAKVRGKGQARLGCSIRTAESDVVRGPYPVSTLFLPDWYQSLIGIKDRLWRCFRHLKVSAIYSHHVIMMLLVVHLIIAHRRLRDVEYYRDDEMVKRVLGLKSVATS